jgi:hypothetical protein
MIPKSMDPSIIVPATEKIIERLVVSGRFTVLDRANIESVLKEREFQVSGMVSDQDIVTAGKYLGADFVVVAKISQVSETYFISAKMIAIKTGVIANQTSAQAEGKLSVLIALSSQVGEALSGQKVLPNTVVDPTKDKAKGGTGETVTKDKQPGQDVLPPPIAPPPKAPDKLRTTILASFGGGAGQLSDSSGTIDGSGVGGDIFALIPVIGGLVVATNADFMSFTDSSSSAITWSEIDILAGLGYALRLGAFVPYLDVKGGFTSSSLNGNKNYSGSGGAIGLDLGLNFNLGRWVVLGARYQYIGASVSYTGFSEATSLMNSGFFASVGVRF